MEEKHYYRGGLIWPAILIGAGIVFLLNNLGIVGSDIWLTLLRLWPVLLIAIGLDILIGRKSAIGSLVVALLLLGVLALVVTGAIRSPDQVASAVVDRTESIDQELKGATQADVEIDFGTGNLLIAALPEGSDKLLSGTADLARTDNLQIEQSASGDRAKLVVRSKGSWTVGPEIIESDNKKWDLELNRDISISLAVSTGVGRSTLDLSQIDLSQLTINGGLGSVTVKLPASGRFNMKLDGGVGSTTVIIPEGMGARIRMDGGLSGVEAQGDFTRRDREYVSSDYSGSEDRVDISADRGLGRIVVRQATE